MRRFGLTYALPNLSMTPKGVEHMKINEELFSAILSELIYDAERR